MPIDALQEYAGLPVSTTTLRRLRDAAQHMLDDTRNELNALRREAAHAEHAMRQTQIAIDRAEAEMHRRETIVSGFELAVRYGTDAAETEQGRPVRRSGTHSAPEASAARTRACSSGTRGSHRTSYGARITS